MTDTAVFAADAADAADTDAPGAAATAGNAPGDGAGASRGEADVLRFAEELGASSPLFRPVLEEAAAFWSPDSPPSTVLLGGLGSAFAAGFGALGAGERGAVLSRVERGLSGPAGGPLDTAVATGFVEALVHRGEADGTWPALEAALGPRARAYADAYRGAPFHAPPHAAQG